MPHLFDEFTIKSVTLRNRIGVSPMCQYSSINGMATDWHLVHLGSRAVGGAALIVAEATAVEPRGRISPQDAGIWSDEHIAPLARINRFIKSQGAIPGIQLAHAGRKGSVARPWEGGHSLRDEEGGWETIAPSPLAFDKNIWRAPKEMSREDIHNIIENFRVATKRAGEAGYEWLELHAAHGYLIHEFYSPLTNKRTDEYGGSFENRIRFVIETIRAMREAWSEGLPLTLRLSCSDWVEGGWTIEDSIELAKVLKTEGVDLIDCSSGFNSPDHARYPFGDGWQVPFSERIRKEAEIATAAVGSIHDAQQAEEIISKGQADIVFLAREMLREPYWANKAAMQLNQNSARVVPDQYERAYK